MRVIDRRVGIVVGLSGEAVSVTAIESERLLARHRVVPDAGPAVERLSRSS